MRYLFSLSKDEWKRVLMHIPVGIVTIALGYFISQWVGVLFGFGFLVYEAIELLELGNGSWKDIKGWLWGLGLTGLVIKALELGEIL